MKYPLPSPASDLTSRPRCAALIVAAGVGRRMGGPLPKQYRRLGDRTVLAHAIAGFAAMPIYIAIASGEEDRARAAIAGLEAESRVHWVMGGAERQDSVLSGLEAMARTGAPDIVFVHDAARPLVDADTLERLIAALAYADGAVPVLPIPDSVARFSDDDAMTETVTRTGLARVQTPQAFSFPKLLAAYRDHARACAQGSAATATDEAGLAFAAGLTVRKVAGSTRLEKLTTEADFETLETRLDEGKGPATRTEAGALVSRVATGYDVHRLLPGGRLWLGGVVVSEDWSLSGHSDADVALHALTDALLGTIGAGDIGTHFPPTDPQWRGAASDQFLSHARDLVRERGGYIDFVDLTIICERPRIGPHRIPMRARIAEILAISPDQVSIKATTTEGLGFTGRGEGIAAQAAASVRVPYPVTTHIRSSQ